MLSRLAKRRIASHCISKSGACPCDGCEEDGECYLWRCENPHAPEPEPEQELPEKSCAIRSAMLAIAAWCVQWSWLLIY
jgi:hypothetical protein